MNSEFQLLQGSALDVLKGMPDESVQVCITSPPYYGLRSYGTEPQVWGNHNGCTHEWKAVQGKSQSTPKAYAGRFGSSNGEGRTVKSTESITIDQDTDFCLRCSAWRGELGLEPTFQLYIAHLIEIFAEVKRVLKRDGCAFVNLGDTYAAARGGSPMPAETIAGGVAGYGDTVAKRGRESAFLPHRNAASQGLQHKSLMQIPARFYIAMTDELGFIKRNKLIWYKRACMPSSAKDRFTVDFEEIGFFTKEPRYKFNQQFEPHLSYESTAARNNLHNKGTKYEARKDMNDGERSRLDYFHPEGRNKRCVWDVPFEPSGDEHYAAYPTKLIEPMILAGSDEGDTVLDIFAGTGTTLAVALKHKRKALGIELQPKYIEIAKRRLSVIQPTLLSF